MEAQGAPHRVCSAGPVHSPFGFKSHREHVSMAIASKQEIALRHWQNVLGWLTGDQFAIARALRRFQGQPRSSGSQIIELHRLPWKCHRVYWCTAEHVFYQRANVRCSGRRPSPTAWLTKVTELFDSVTCAVTRRTSVDNGPVAGWGWKHLDRPSVRHGDGATDFRIMSGLTPKNAGDQMHQSRRAYQLRWSRYASDDTMSDGRIDGVFGDIPPHAHVIVITGLVFG